MRINLNLPDWPLEEGRGLYILAGVEPIAIKLPNQPWQVKTGRCSQCGNCCEFKRTTSSESFLSTYPKEGSPEVMLCKYLIPDGLTKRVCQLGLERPFICCTATRSIAGCTVTYETVKA